MSMIQRDIQKQPGRKFSYSNQSVVCGIFTTKSKAKQYIPNKNFLIRQKSDQWFDGLEHWIFFNINEPFTCRGYRFYKIKIDKNIDRKMFFEHIYPCCSVYCKEIEFI